MGERGWLFRSRALTLAALLGTLGYAACEEPDEDEGPGSVQGNFGPGTFSYRCINDNDPACAGGSVKFPDVLAVGSRFDLNYANAKEPTPQVVAPAADFVKRSEGSFEVLQAGFFAVLALAGNGDVQNAIHLRAADIAELRVQKKDGLPLATLALDPGETATITAAPVDHVGTSLLGALTYDWQVADPAVLSFQSLTTLNRVSVRGGNVGRSELVVKVAGQDFHVAVVVGDPPDAGPALVLDGGALDATTQVQTDTGVAP